MNDEGTPFLCYQLKLKDMYRCKESADVLENFDGVQRFHHGTVQAIACVRDE